LNCKFFGALTYTVNLNHYKTIQENINIDEILQRLLIHTSNQINELLFQSGKNYFIIRKLFSNLSLIFNSYKLRDLQWVNPLNSLIVTLISNSPPSIENLNNQVNLMEFFQLANKQKIFLKLIINFSSIIVEDLLKIGRDAQKVPIHELVYSDLYQTTKASLIYCFESGDDELKFLGLEGLQSWIQYISFVENNTAVRYHDLNDLLQFLFIFLQDENEEILSKAMELLTDIFENNPLLMNHDLRKKFSAMLMSQWSLKIINQYMEAEDFDALTNFGSLVIAFLEIDCMQLTKNIMQNQNSEFLKFLLNLTNFPLIPIIQENLSRKFVDLWCQVLEIFTDDMDMLITTLKNDSLLIEETTKNSGILFQELSMIYFNKIQLSIISNPEFKHNEQEFFSFRADSMEIFELIFTKLGPDLYQNLASSILNNSDINQVEASLYILTGLSMNFMPDNVDDRIINSVETLFQGNFLTTYNDLTKSLDSVNTQLYVKTSIKFLGAIEFFYKKKNVDYLNTVIDYLFTCLKNFPSLQFLISKTVMDICDNCRTQLVSSIPNFEPILVEMIRNPGINNYTREKFINSISCIIQSLPDPITQESHVYHIIELIESTCQPFMEKASQNNITQEEVEFLISLFTSLYELGKGLSLPDDLEEEQPELYNNFLVFYKNNDGRIQHKVSNIVNMFAVEIQSLANNSEVSEKACLIYKIGLLEEFGPFAFSNQTVLQFAMTKSALQNTPQVLTYILELLITLISTGLHSKPTNQNILSQSEVSNIIQHFVINQYEVISQDPDLLQISLNLLTSILVHKPAFLLHEETSLAFAIQTAMSLLYSHEKFVIKAASKFWVTFLSARKTSAEDSKLIQQSVENNIGPTLTFKVFESLIDASRSDVDTYSSIIVVLFAKYQLRFKDWCRDALLEIDNQRQASGKHPIQDRELFIKKLIVTRASTRKCNELIKEFWITTNGLISYT